MSWLSDIIRGKQTVASIIARYNPTEELKAHAEAMASEAADHTVTVNTLTVLRDAALAEVAKGKAAIERFAKVFQG